MICSMMLCDATPITTVRERESTLASNFSFLIRFTIHFSASSSSMFSFLDIDFMCTHWWILQYVSNIASLAFYRNSSLAVARK